MSSPEHKKKIWEMIKDIKVGMLVTLDDDMPRARPMHLVQDAYDGTLWFYTRRSAEKVTETDLDHDVCLTFLIRIKVCMFHSPARLSSVVTRN